MIKVIITNTKKNNFIGIYKDSINYITLPVEPHEVGKELKIKIDFFNFKRRK